MPQQAPTWFSMLLRVSIQGQYFQSLNMILQPWLRPCSDFASRQNCLAILFPLEAGYWNLSVQRMVLSSGMNLKLIRMCGIRNTTEWCPFSKRNWGSILKTRLPDNSTWSHSHCQLPIAAGVISGNECFVFLFFSKTSLNLISAGLLSYEFFSLLSWHRSNWGWRANPWYCGRELILSEAKECLYFPLYQ
jgi:hypothetical protein